ncbi:MAG: hypothetical protein LUC27_04990 [Lachnospiraceae bacterium]|nr:hypothetical protein [Lachnospiraceae bacterium]
MRTQFTRLLVLSFGLGLLIWPERSCAGASGALLQWYRNVLPVLLPFLLLARLISVLFPLSQRRRKQSVCLMGFLCGYPMGAILTGNEVRDKQITSREGQRLVCLCNLPSPAFLTGLVAIKWLHLSRPLRLLAAVWSASVLCCLLLAVFQNKEDFMRERTPRCADSSSKEPAALSPALLEKAWIESCQSAVVIGCYMILFGILASWLAALSSLPEIVRISALLLCEITTGCQAVAESTLPLTVREMLCAAGAAFGGLSCLAQTSGCLHDTGIRLSSYAGGRLLTALLAALLDLGFQHLFP